MLLSGMRRVGDVRSVFPVAASGLVIDWEQKTGRLFASGDVRTIQVWDAHRELKIQVGAVAGSV